MKRTNKYFGFRECYIYNIIKIDNLNDDDIPLLEGNLLARLQIKK
jgi:hypothetical protein